MAVKDSRRERGRRRGQELTSSLLGELRTTRQVAGLSQAGLAKTLGWPQSRFSEFERGKRSLVVAETCEVAALLGLKAVFNLVPDGEPTLDAGHHKLIGRLIALLSSAWHVVEEAPFPNLGDLRSWDLLLRLGRIQLVGAEAETRVRDQQHLVRRIRQREIHGGTDVILVALSDTVHNREQADPLRFSLGSSYSTPAQSLLTALRDGRPLPGSGVVLL